MNGYVYHLLDYALLFYIKFNCKVIDVQIM